VKAAEDLTLKLHYHRADGNYDGWDVWLWEEGGDGNAYAFEEEDGEMVATKVIAPGVSSVGFIVRTADWTKDINEDQFIDISEMVSGTVHIYVESGKKGYTKEYGEDAVTGTKLLKARYEEETQMITVQMTGKIDGDFKKAFSILGTDGEAAITEVTEEAQFTYLISVERPLDLTKNYNILFDGNEYKIIMPNIYSTESFEEQYTYTGTDLGATWSSDKTSFRVWAPTAEAVKVNLYASGTEGTDDLLEEIPMQADVNGTWIAEKEGDANGIYYTYTVTINGEETEACDPYARTTGVNGKRAMIIDLASTNPQGWESDANPHAGENITDAVIYELHVRDLSSDESAGIQNVGKFLGVIETGTTTESGIPTGLDHIKDLGITHLHLLPSYDYGSVDETKLDDAKFNWGYDPVNYNVPEGSYSTDPYHGEVRVKEMKQMVQGLHENGISVVMDVVYNHVYNASEFCFNKIVPGYFSRMDEEGKYSNGSGCGNDTASERAMVHKYIVDSVKYWAEEYHIDGFRFDLVGLIDTETINEIVAEVHKDYPDVIFYGEGWTMDTSVTKDGYLMATQLNSEETPDFAYFNDTMRDGLKGNVFENSQTGYVSGAEGLEETITQCFLGAADWCPSPSQTVNYASCHDNLTLMDRLSRSALNATREERIRMNNLSAAIYMTAQGIPFMQAGEEMLRTKLKGSGEFDENSYASPDSVNSLKWDTLNEEEYQNTYNYYKGLIAFRSAHPALRMMTAEDVAANIMPVEGLEANVTAFDIKGGANGDSADGMFVIFNPNQTQTQVTLPEGVWDVYINGEKAGTEVLETITEGTATVAPISAMVLIKGEADAKTAAEPAKKAPFAIGVAAVAAVVAGVVAFMRKKKK
ncbi:MAG: type I pullulanase, partial [Clostridiales bacterium]|nr:type I pullulanase [Clostridiales bacterium]MDY4112681.1 type I pullulanase [Roseburia sp.]